MLHLTYRTRKPKPENESLSPGQIEALKSYFISEGFEGMMHLYRLYLAANARANRAENELRRIRIEGEKW